MSYDNATDRAAYQAERVLKMAYDHSESLSAVFSGVSVQLEPEARFGDLEGIQAYVRRVQAMPSVKAAFPWYTDRPITVRERKHGSRAHYEHAKAVIAVPTTKGSGHCMRETYILHELAHHYANAGGHGKRFRDAYVTLLELVMGSQVSMAMRMSYHAEGAM